MMRAVRALGILLVALFVTVCVAGTIPSAMAADALHDCSAQDGQSVCQAAGAHQALVVAPLPAPQTLVMLNVLLLILPSPWAHLVAEPQVGPLPPRSPPVA